MPRFTVSEITEIDRIWRTLPNRHMWSGWASIGEEPDAIWLYRQRQNWRRFQLVKDKDAYSLQDETGANIATSESLSDVLCDIEVADPLATL